MSYNSSLQGAPKSAGTTDVRVQRIEEGLAAFATLDNPTANPPTVNQFDAGFAEGFEVSAKVVAQIDTTMAGGGGQYGPAFTIAKPSVWP